MFGFGALRLSGLLIRGRLSCSTSLDAECRSSTVCYLVESCRLSIEDAVAVSKKVRIRNPEEADSFRAFLRNYGLKDDQISKIIKIRPRFLVGNPEKNYRPKIEFLLSLGAARDDLGKLLYRSPWILNYGLENRILPFYNFLRHVVLLEDEDIVRILKGSFKLLKKDSQKNIAHNVAKLREIGTSQSFIRVLVTLHPSVALLNCERFNGVVDELVCMGFKPNERKFVDAMSFFGVWSQSAQEHKHDVYRRWGWSEDDIQSAFRRYPICMKLSEENISNTMDFLVNGMHYSSSVVACHPLILGFSLKKRIVPRCSVFKVLQAKGFAEISSPLSSLLSFSEDDFLHKFVSRYKDKIPNLLYLYQGKISLEKVIA